MRVMLTRNLVAQVTCFEIQRNQQGQVNILSRGQIQHEAPVLCSDIASVSILYHSDVVKMDRP